MKASCRAIADENLRSANTEVDLPTCDDDHATLQANSAVLAGMVSFASCAERDLAGCRGLTFEKMISSARGNSQASPSPAEHGQCPEAARLADPHDSSTTDHSGTAPRSRKAASLRSTGRQFSLNAQAEPGPPVRFRVDNSATECRRCQTRNDAANRSRPRASADAGRLRCDAAFADEVEAD